MKSLVINSFLLILIGSFLTALYQILKPKIHENINKIDKYVYATIKHRLTRDIVLYAILAAQKELASEDGKKRFEYAKKIVLNRLPWLAITRVDRIIQEIYDEFTKANLTDNK